MSVFHRRRKKNPLLLSEEEKEIVIEEIAKRMKDIVYITARKQSEQLFNDHMEAFMNYETGELFTITYKVTLCAGDLQQIVARVRREKEEKEGFSVTPDSTTAFGIVIKSAEGEDKFLHGHRIREEEEKE